MFSFWRLLDRRSKLWLLLLGLVCDLLKNMFSAVPQRLNVLNLDNNFINYVGVGLIQILIPLFMAKFIVPKIEWGYRRYAHRSFRTSFRWT